MKKGRMAEIVKELQGASKMHLKQSKEIEAHIDDMGSPAKKNGFGGTPDSTDKQAAYEKATNQLYDEGTITETDDKAVKLIKKRVKKNAKKLSK